MPTGTPEALELWMTSDALAIDGPLHKLLVAATSDMTTCRDKLRELEGREPMIEQYSTAIIGRAITEAFKVGFEAAQPGNKRRLRYRAGPIKDLQLPS